VTEPATEIALDELAGRLGEVALVDVRARHEYEGTGGAHCDPRQGHIPGARHVDLSRLMELSPAAVQDALALDAGAEVVVYCHSGSRSAIAMQILRGLGYEARNYVGSWHEWSRHDDLPVET
jgi:thiosulfate/3-mercaptopyruvate sulfurtransferase